ncbi:MAG: peptidoglycan editing factor PgeF [Tannerellaceae bacterium]|nr:peptidoglycan editing factor PgeF [Tannerellaceae bacterium]
MTDNKNIPLLQFPRLKSESGILHFVTTRRTPAGATPDTSFNLGEYCGDDPNTVRRNRQTLCDALGIDPTHLYVPRQVHGDRALFCEEIETRCEAKAAHPDAPEADALITGREGICIAVSTADCASVLLYAPDRRIVAAIHAGWRGAVNHIVTKTLDRMTRERDCDPQHLRAAIGPSIGPEAFEVGEDVYEAFAAAGMDMTAISHRNPATGKAHIDLKEAVRRQLLDAGLTEDHIEVSDACTCARSADFFSARREGLHTGRMLTGIMLKNA